MVRVQDNWSTELNSAVSTLCVLIVATPGYMALYKLSITVYMVKKVSLKPYYSIDSKLLVILIMFRFYYISKHNQNDL